MILVEKRALKEEKNYLNMVIRRKKNFKLSYYKSNKSFRKFLKKKLRFQRRFKKILCRYSSSRKKLLVKKIWRQIYLKRYSLKYLKARVDSTRIKVRLYRYSRYLKRKAWRLKYRRYYKKAYKKLIRSTFTKKIGYYRLLNNFYKDFGLYDLLRNIVKYRRIKRILKKKRKVFKKRPKKIIPKLSRTRIQNLDMLGYLFRGVISKGNKKLAGNIFLDLLFLLKLKYKNEFIKKYLEALEIIRPLIYYRTMFISGKKYKIPVLMPITKSYKISIRWMLQHSSENVILSLFNNITNALSKTGSLVKFRKEYHFQSFENKTYIRFLRFLKTGF